MMDTEVKAEENTVDTGTTLTPPPSETITNENPSPAPIEPSHETLPPVAPFPNESPKAVNVDTKPEDIRYLTIKNLDTGEEFIIGETDPDFDFDTFEIGAKLGDTPIDQQQIHENQKLERISWWKAFFNYIYRNKSTKDHIDEKVAANIENHSSLHGNNSNKPKTPFTKLSSFRFRKELGRGAFGRVLLAEAKTDGKLYALKIISKKNMRSSDRRQAKAERDILHCMTLKAPHPFTSGLKFAFQSENHLYLGMDYIPGGNLRELIKRFKYLPQDWVQFYAAELILAISHLHSLNVLYRDIKPHNVMIDARGHLILIDFGLSKQEISHPRGALSLVGTPDYSAPEVLRTGVQQIEAHNREKAMRAKHGKKYKGAAANGGKKEEEGFAMQNIGYGKAADWWSLGIMIYEMLAGKPTFRGQDLRETYQKILYAKLEFNPEERFSPEAKQLLEGLINRDPQIRLGAWENPPKDIMSSAFFSNVQWDAIFERKQDGPWLPDLPGFYRRNMMTGSAKSNADEPDTTFTKIDFTPPPYHRMTEDPNAANNNNNDNNKAPRRATLDNTKKLANDEEEDEEEEEEDEDSSDNEQEDIAVRDSVFISNQNEVPGWSYIDEAVLMSYISSLAEKKEEKLEKEKRKKEKEEKKLQRQLKSGATTTASETAEETPAVTEGEQTEQKE